MRLRAIRLLRLLEAEAGADCTPNDLPPRRGTQPLRPAIHGNELQGGVKTTTQPASDSGNELPEPVPVKQRHRRYMGQADGETPLPAV